MSDFGGWGIFPIEFGGEPGEEEKIYRALMSMVGEGGASSDTLEVTTLDGAWRAAKAKGIAAGFVAERAAHWQGFPDSATDELGTYEEVLGYVPPPEWTEQDRRLEVTRRWTTPARGDQPTLQDELERINANFVLLEPMRNQEGGTIPGRMYDAIDKADGTGSFGFGRVGSNFPAFSDAYLISALLPMPTTPAEGAALGYIQKAEELLARRIPAWCDFSVGLVEDGIDLQSTQLPGGDYLGAALFGAGGFF